MSISGRISGAIITGMLTDVIKTGFVGHFCADLKIPTKMLKIGMLVGISESSLMMEIITFFATMKDKILGRSMEFEQREKCDSIY